jgi:hypothetical protein
VRDDTLGDHVGKLTEEPFHPGDRFFVALDLDLVAAGAQMNTIDIFDEPKIFVKVSEKAGDRFHILNYELRRVCFHQGAWRTCDFSISFNAILTLDRGKVNKTHDPERPKANLPRRHKGMKNSNSVSQEQKAQRSQFILHLLRFFCGKRSFPRCEVI